MMTTDSESTVAIESADKVSTKKALKIIVDMSKNKIRKGMLNFRKLFFGMVLSHILGRRSLPHR